MTFDPEARTIRFASQAELDRFHHELSVLIRTVMVASTKHLLDEHEAKSVSREVIKENHTLFSALNALRESLPRTAF
jgi:hypothetical protein